jgi:hypothetical protein
MANPNPSHRFTKGDPRIWRGGRPKSFPALQELAQQIAHETAKAGGATVIIDGHAVTVAEMILRQWAQSKSPALQQKFIEVAFGKVPTPVDVRGEGGGALVIRLAWDDNDNDTAPEAP